MNCKQLQYSELFFFVVDVNEQDPQRKDFYAQCMLCGKKVYPFNSNSTKNGWLKWRSEILVTHLQSIHHCVSPLISKSFLSFSTLYNSMKTEEIMKNTTISFGHSSKQQKLNSGERVSVSTSGSEISFLSNTPLICLSGLQSISKLDVTTVMRIISIKLTFLILISI